MFLKSMSLSIISVAILVLTAHLLGAISDPKVEGDNNMSVTINGKRYKGNNVSIVNNVVMVDGKKVESEENDSGKIILRIEGDFEKLLCDGNLEIEGNVDCKELVVGKSLSCGNIDGGVFSKGSVNCGDIDGSLEAGGSVNCGDVGGNLNAGGSVSAGDVSGSVNR